MSPSPTTRTTRNDHAPGEKDLLSSSLPNLSAGANYARNGPHRKTDLNTEAAWSIVYRTSRKGGLSLMQKLESKRQLSDLISTRI